MSNTILSKVADTVMDKATIINVDVNYKNRWLNKMQQWKLLAKQRQFTITPIKLGSLIRISQLFLQVNISVDDIRGKWKDASYQAMMDHTEVMAKIIATAIQNSRQEAPQSLVNFILNHFSAKEMLAVINIVISKMDLTSFIATIVSARGINVLENPTAGATSVSKQETSPLTRTETIAPGTSLEE